MNTQEMTRDESTCLLYLETVAVDNSGLVESVRMNDADWRACEKFGDLELIQYGRIKADKLGTFVRQVTHWVVLTPAGFALAHQLRMERAARGLQDKLRTAAVPERDIAHEQMLAANERADNGGVNSGQRRWRGVS